jgi:MFS family permease
MTGLSVSLILYGPASYLVFSLGMFFCGIANGSYALTFVVVGSSVPRQYIGAAFGFANMAILAVGSLLFQPLIGILARMRGLVVPDANALSVLMWAQAIGLLLLLPLGWRSREEPPASDLKAV